MQDEYDISYPLFKRPTDVTAARLSLTLGGVTVNASGQVVAAKAWLLVYPLRSNTKVRVA